MPESSTKMQVVKGLNADSFKMEIAGTPVRLTNAALDSGPKRVALLLDNSPTVPDVEERDVRFARTLYPCPNLSSSAMR
jgi:hypothetical protein